jgi:Transcriptional activator of glycolytic enzymes
VEVSLRDIEEPDEVRLRRIVPDISNRLDMTRKDVVRSIEEHGTRNHRMLESMHKRLEDLFAGRVSIIIYGGEIPPPINPQAPRTITDEGLNTSRTTDHQPLQSSYATSSTTVVAAPSSQPLDLNAPAPTHQMSRTVFTVPDLYQEWMFGLGSAPAIQALEDAYGPQWRPSQAERVFFGRRKVIISEIQRRQELGEAPKTVVEELELVRKRMKMTLHGLQKWLIKLKAQDL